MFAERIARFDSPIIATSLNANGNLFSLSTAGDIYLHGKTDLWSSNGGQPLGFLVDPRGFFFVCDAAHQAVFRISRTVDANGNISQESEPYVKDFEGRPLLGPNSVAFSKKNGGLFFTDSGPIGESSFANPRGSVFMVHPKTQLFLPLALNCLSHPSGVALSSDENAIYVCETLKNRIIRFVQKPVGVWHMSVFLQLSGRLGPTAICSLPQGMIAVAHYDFLPIDVEPEDLPGKILIIAADGQIIDEKSVPGPEITSITPSFDASTRQTILYVSEAITRSIYKITLS